MRVRTKKTILIRFIYEYQDTNGINRIAKCMFLGEEVPKSLIEQFLFIVGFIVLLNIYYHFVRFVFGHYYLHDKNVWEEDPYGIFLLWRHLTNVSASWIQDLDASTCIYWWPCKKEKKNRLWPYFKIYTSSFIISSNWNITKHDMDPRATYCLLQLAIDPRANVHFD